MFAKCGFPAVKFGVLWPKLVATFLTGFEIGGGMVGGTKRPPRNLLGVGWWAGQNARPETCWIRVRSRRRRKNEICKNTIWPRAMGKTRRRAGWRKNDCQYRRSVEKWNSVKYFNNVLRPFAESLAHSSNWFVFGAPQRYKFGQ